MENREEKIRQIDTVLKTAPDSFIAGIWVDCANQYLSTSIPAVKELKAQRHYQKRHKLRRNYYRKRHDPKFLRGFAKTLYANILENPKITEKELRRMNPSIPYGSIGSTLWNLYSRHFITREGIGFVKDPYRYFVR